MNEVLESSDIDMLRGLAVESWRRAERLETEYAKVVEAKTKAIADKTKAVEEKKVVQAKFDALVSENETLLARIAELTRRSPSRRTGICSWHSS